MTITLTSDVTLGSPVKFVKGEGGDKVVLNLNGHTLTGRAGTTSKELDNAVGGNAIEIAADEFDVEIKGPGSVIGGKGGKLDRDDYSGYRVGVHGGSAVFFCTRVDNVHSTTGQWGDIIDEGYHPDTLEHGLTVTGGANLTGGAGADVSLNDWKHNLSIGRFDIVAGRGGDAISQVFSNTEDTAVLEELSYAKIVIENGSAAGGAGGNVSLGDQLLTTTDIQKLDEIQQYMQGKEASYDFDSNVINAISFVPADGGNGIEFFAGRKYIEIGAGGTVTGGDGGKFNCSEKASMVNTIDTQCGDGGIGVYVCGDTGLTNTKPSLTTDSWTQKTGTSDDVGVYVAGTVKGGNSPSTTLRGDSSGAGGTGIDCDLENVCEPYSVEHGHRPTFDADRGIVLVGNGGKVMGGASGAPNETNISGGQGADAMNGGSVGSPTGGTRMSAAYFIINGELTGGYGSSQGGTGFYMKSEKEYLDDTQSSAYFGAVVCGNGTIKGGDSGEWPHIGSNYTTSQNGVISRYVDDSEEIVCGEGFRLKYGNHENATIIDQGLSISDGAPAKLMTTTGTFKLTPTMTTFPLETGPTANTKLSCAVQKPDGYKGKIYITWSAVYEATTPRTVRIIEGANGAYNNFSILSTHDYPYGWRQESYGRVSTVNVATREHIAERLYYNSTVRIYCHAQLEDGRFIDNDDIWFNKNEKSSKGWSGSGGDSGQAAADQAAADRVYDMIYDLPLLSQITLEHADAVAAARAAYDDLTDAQKELLSPYTSLLSDLENAEARIATLMAPVTAVVEKINSLPDIDAVLAGGDEEEIAAAKQSITDAVNAYNNLSEIEKSKVDSEAIETLKSAVNTYNASNPEDPIAAPTVQKITPSIKLSRTSYTWTGGAQIPAVTVTAGNKTLTKDTDYTLSAPTGRDVGRHIFKVTLKGNYAGEGTASYTISPKGTSVAKLKKAKKGFTVKWKKQTAKMSSSRITGYQVQYSLKKNFKGAKTKTIKGYKKSSKKIGKLKKKKKYYVRVRTYMKVGGATYYSPWSAAKKVKTK